MDGTASLPEFQRNIMRLLPEDKKEEFDRDFNCAAEHCKDITGVRDKFVIWVMEDLAQAQYGSVEAQEAIGCLLRAGYPDDLEESISDAVDSAYEAFKDENEGPDSNCILFHGHTPEYYVASLISEAYPKEGYRGIIASEHAAVYGAIAYRDAYKHHKSGKRVIAMCEVGIRQAEKILELIHSSEDK